MWRYVLRGEVTTMKNQMNSLAAEGLLETFIEKNCSGSP
jgi:hypothetical protein